MSGEALQFDTNGLLVDGAHECTLADIESAFGSFQSTERRPRLYAKLRAFVAELGRASWDVELIVDGSFVMRCVDIPEDIDLVLVLPEGWDMQAELRPVEYNLLSRRRVKATYGFDLFAVRRGSPEQAAMVEFFRQVNPKWRALLGTSFSSRKGLVRIKP